MRPPSPEPSPDATGSFQAATQIDRLREAFVRAWRSGQRPRIEEHLQAVAESVRGDSLVELIREEIALRRQAGEPVTVAEYLSRFPRHQQTVLQAFDSTGAPRAMAVTFDLDRSRSAGGLETQAPAMSTPALTVSSRDRYRKLHQLGQGAFGTVWLAEDLELRRQVALKEPRADRLRTAADIEAYLSEARVLASLDHPHIVPVHDVGRTADGSCYVVSKLIDGMDLGKYAQQQRLSFDQVAQLVAKVADALQHTHDRGLVHRDIKPANILIDSQGRPYLTDFGLALREEELGKQQGLAGTPAYMSPEQARGEGHLVDGRSDIFSLGVVLYELLVGARPFSGASWQEVLEQITAHEAKPPRQWNESIPKELDRICLKALAKRAADRYARAADLAEELRLWAAPPATSFPPAATTKIVPKGLRSFDAADSDFFLELLPGPRDREGLPDVLRFWKTRLEETNPGKTFRVGLMYGPSGCGKSSLMKAGLLPRLADHVVRVFLEATPDETEEQLLQALRRTCADLPRAASLVDTLAAIRRGQGIPAGRKIVLILDQFEQWLHAHGTEQHTDLVAALRQCDGERLQAVLLVRDDFYRDVNCLMQQIEVPLREGQNQALVDRFDPLHARHVLAEFGRAHGRLPENLGQLSSLQATFLDQAVNGIAQDGKVICVRLALFADMMKGRPWTPASLHEVGGAAGLGATFLEETFSNRAAPLQHQYHQDAVRAVLRALLPPTGTDIKGHRQSNAQLLEASGYASRPRDFADLLSILDSELRLITPVGNETAEGSDGRLDQQASPAGDFTSSGHESQFQLTHDYLVPSLREWLSRKQLETRQGRAALKLDERSLLWAAKPENRYLPSLAEWLAIRLWTDARHWSSVQKSMMRRAARLHGATWGSLLAALVLLALGVQWWVSAERWRNLSAQSRTAAESLQSSLGPAVPVNIKELQRLPKELVLAELQARAASATNPRHQLSLAFALAAYERLDARELVSRIDEISESDTRNFVTALQTDPAKSLAALKTAAATCESKSLERRKAKLAVAALGVGDVELARQICVFEHRPDPEPRTLFIDECPRWDLDWSRLADVLANCDDPALRSAICLAVGQRPVERIPDAERDAWCALAARWFAEHGDSTTHSAAGWLLRKWRRAEPNVARQHEIMTQREWFVNSVGATMLHIRRRPPAEIQLRDPVDRFRRQLERWEDSAIARQTAPDVREARAIAYFHTERFADALRDLDFCLKHAAQDRHASIMMFRTLALARLGQRAETQESLQTYLRRQDVSAAQKAYVQIQVPAWRGETTVAAQQLESTLAAVGDDPVAIYLMARAAAMCAQAAAKRDAEQSRRFADRALGLVEKLTQLGFVREDDASQEPDFRDLRGEPRFAGALTAMRPQLATRVPAQFWVADREVSRGEFERFMNDDSYPAAEKPMVWEGVATDASPTAEHPAQNVSWYDAVLYCNWLSRREGRRACYERTGTREKSRDPFFGKEGEGDTWRLVANGTGYRLLTAAEWEYACRSGSQTEFCSGNDEGLLAAYCQMYASKSNATCGFKLPNAWGLHDMHGNVLEWCEDLVQLESGAVRVSRGGSFDFAAEHCGSGSRSPFGPNIRVNYLGFRLALSSAEQERSK